MLKLFWGDIADLAVEAVVNAANNHLWMGSGVAGAIKHKGGTKIEQEAVALGPIPVGEAVITGGGDLKAKYVIHAASMGQDLRTDQDKVRAATKNTLLRARELKISTIAFPALGTGVGGLSTLTAAKVMVSEVRRHLAVGSSIKEVIFALYDQKTYEHFKQIVERDKIVCLGDSITYGYPYSPEVSWVKLAAEKLGIRMVNRGVNGDTTEQMLDRFESEVLSLEPAFVIILGGTNDAFLGIGLDRVKAAVGAMISRSLQEGICPVPGLPVALSTEGILAEFPGEDLSGMAGDLDRIRDWIRDFSGKLQLPAIDFYTPLLEGGGGEGNRRYFVDGCHPSRAGYQALARAVEAELARLKSLLVV